MKRLENKIALVTGASQGIGYEIVKIFVNEGAIVIVADLAQLSYKLDNTYGYSVDVTKRKELEVFFKEILEKFGIPDILVNNAGITKDALIHKMSEDMWDKVIDVNLKGPYNITQLVAPYMVNRNSGNIINIASIVGEYGNVGQTNYSATKAGIIGMTKTWAKEFTRKGANIRVNSVSPGFINTDMMKTIPEDVLNNIKAKTMLNRLGEPIEIAKAVLFLACDESSYITGHNLSVNGGMRL